MFNFHLCTQLNDIAIKEVHSKISLPISWIGVLSIPSTEGSKEFRIKKYSKGVGRSLRKPLGFTSEEEYREIFNTLRYLRNIYNLVTFISL